MVSCFSTTLLFPVCHRFWVRLKSGLLLGSQAFGSIWCYIVLNSHLWHGTPKYTKIEHLWTSIYDIFQLRSYKIKDLGSSRHRKAVLDINIGPNITWLGECFTVESYIYVIIFLLTLAANAYNTCRNLLQTWLIRKNHRTQL